MKNVPFTILLLIIISYIMADQMFLTPKIAFVNTGKLLVGFSEASKVEKEIKAEDDK